MSRSSYETNSRALGLLERTLRPVGTDSFRDSFRQQSRFVVVLVFADVVGDSLTDGFAGDRFAATAGDEQERSVGVCRTNRLEECQPGPVAELVVTDHTVGVETVERRAAFSKTVGNRHLERVVVVFEQPAGDPRPRLVVVDEEDGHSIECAVRCRRPFGSGSRHWSSLTAVITFYASCDTW